METKGQRIRHALITAWTLAVIVFLYLPTVCITIASFTASRYFQFPMAKFGLDWWDKTFNSIEIRQLLSTSISIALCVTVIAVMLAFFGALAFARYDWKGRSIYQKLILLPIFFPQSVLGLALLLWFNMLGLQLSWMTAVFAHLVWIVPVVTLVISIQVYSFDPALEEAAFDLGATRWQVLREVTLPVLFPGLLLGRTFCLSFVLGKFPPVALHHRCRYDRAGISLCQDGCRLHAGRARARHRVHHRRRIPADRRLRSHPRHAPGPPVRY